MSAYIRHIQNACICTGITSHPECPVDHLTEEENRNVEIAERVIELMHDPDWLDETMGGLSISFWKLFIDRDDLAFCNQLRKELAATANEVASQEIRRTV